MAQRRPREVVVRDTIRLTNDIKYREILSAGGTLCVVARLVELAGDYDLDGGHLEIRADVLRGNGFNIFNVPPAQPAIGEIGGEGAKGVEESGGPDGPTGGTGGRGLEGAMGPKGLPNPATVTISALIVEGSLVIDLPGGQGGQGGMGGPGGPASVVHYRAEDLQVFAGNGGDGGPGGPGGVGGKGGAVTLVTVSGREGVAVQNKGGMRGPGGKGGSGNGGGGFVLTGPAVGSGPDTPQTTTFFGGGQPGERGPAGPEPQASDVGESGTLTNTKIDSDAAYWSHITSLPIASDWAAFRVLVAEFHFRRYVPNDPEDNTRLAALDEITRAAAIFPAILRAPELDSVSGALLNPPSHAYVLRQTIQDGLTPLGLDPNLDLVPNFQQYSSTWGILHAPIASLAAVAITHLGLSSGSAGVSSLLENALAKAEDAVSTNVSEIAAAKQLVKDTATAGKALADMLAQARQDVIDQQEALKPKRPGFTQLLEQGFQIASAVAALAGAAPTGGASLVALAPTVMTLGETLWGERGEIIDEIVFKDEPDVIADVEKQADKVGKQIADVKKATDKAVDLVKLIDTLTSKGKASGGGDGGRLFDLLRRATQLAFDVLVNKQEQDRAAALVVSLSERGVRLDGIRVGVKTLQQGAVEQQYAMDQAGLYLIRALQSRYIDVLLGEAFRAQRSAEIYLARSLPRAVLYDAGYIHPDLEADFVYPDADPTAPPTAARKQRERADFLSQYTASLSKLVEPIRLRAPYQAFLDNKLDDDTFRRTFNDPAELAAFRATRTLSFFFDVTKEISESRYHTKIQDVAVALIGAKGDGGVVSCLVSHGAVYEQRLVAGDGPLNKTRLEALADNQLAGTDGIKAPPALGWTPPLDSTNALKYWGRGVGGLWTISVEESQMQTHHVDLEGLKGIELWISYHYQG